MAGPLNNNVFLVKQHPSPLRAVFDCDVMDPESGRLLMQCRETPPGRAVRFFRLAGYAATTPFEIGLRDMDGKLLGSVRRGVPVTASRVKVFDQDGVLVGGFRQKAFSMGGSFDVVDRFATPICRLDGGMMGRSFRFIGPGGEVMASVTKKWAGLGKELLTSADDYVLDIDRAVPRDGSVRLIIFASVICVGIVMKIHLP